MSHKCSGINQHASSLSLSPSCTRTRFIGYPLSTELLQSYASLLVSPVFCWSSRKYPAHNTVFSAPKPACPKCHCFFFRPHCENTMLCSMHKCKYHTALQRVHTYCTGLGGWELSGVLPSHSPPSRSSLAPGNHLQNFLWWNVTWYHLTNLSSNIARSIHYGYCQEFHFNLITFCGWTALRLIVKGWKEKEIREQEEKYK